MSKEEVKQVSRIFYWNNFYFKNIFIQLFKKFDNGNGRLSLAEIDRAIIDYYPQFATNKKAIMRAYKAADTSGVWNERKKNV
jgi:hypothetical protein